MLSERIRRENKRVARTSVQSGVGRVKRSRNRGLSEIEIDVVTGRVALRRRSSAPVDPNQGQDRLGVRLVPLEDRREITGIASQEEEETNQSDPVGHESVIFSTTQGFTSG